MRAAHFASTIIVFVAVGSASTARADDATSQRAKAAYEKGVQASDRKDYAEAGKDFAEADSLSPNAVALEAALQVAVLADDPILGDELLERSKRDPSLNQDVVKSARDKFMGRAGHLDVQCDTCTATVDGQPTTSKSIWLLIGNHAVHLSDGGRAFDTKVTIAADAGTAAKMPPPQSTPPLLPIPAEPQPKPAPSSGRLISPAWAIGGAVVTVGLGAGLIGSALDTRSKYNAFIAARGNPPAHTPQTKALSDSGKSAELRTNVLVAATTVVGAATVVLGILSINFHSQGRTQGQARLGLASNGLSLEGGF